MRRQARLSVARLLAAKGIAVEPTYPDVATKERASRIATASEQGKPPKLLPK